MILVGLCYRNFWRLVQCDFFQRWFNSKFPSKVPNVGENSKNRSIMFTTDSKKYKMFRLAEVRWKLLKAWCFLKNRSKCLDIYEKYPLESVLQVGDSRGKICTRYHNREWRWINTCAWKTCTSIPETFSVQFVCTEEMLHWNWMKFNSGLE